MSDLTVRVPASLPQEWRGETYHDRPVVKASSFDWRVTTYIALLGVGGSAQVIAALAGRDQRRADSCATPGSWRSSAASSGRWC